MPTTIKPEDIDLNSLIASVGQEIDKLIKSESEKLQALKKEEESPKEESKEESSKEESSKEESEQSMKKNLRKDDEKSSMQPQETEEAPEMEAQPEAPEHNEQDGELESLEGMVKDLDDDMLHELMQVVQAELDSRSAPEQAPEAPQAPEAHQEQPALPMDAAMKSEIEELKNKLSKSEEESKSIQKAFETLTQLFNKAVSRPVAKAVTNIKDVQYTDKGEGALKKSEQANISDEEIRKQLTKISSDQKAMASLTKSERDAMLDFFTSKKSRNEVLKIINK